MLEPVLEVPPATSPILLDETKQHLRVTSTSEDDLIQQYIDGATNKFDAWEGILGRALVTQTWAFRFDGFPGGDRLRLPLVPITAVTVEYYDANDELQTLDPAIYRLHQDALGAYLALAGNNSWPGTETRDDAVKVSAVCGYGDAAAVPQVIKQAMLLTVGHFYQNREQVVVGTIAAELPQAATALVAPFRRVGFGT